TKRLPSTDQLVTALPVTTLPSTAPVPGEPAPVARKASPVAGLLELLAGAMAKVRLPGRSGRTEPKPAIPRFNERAPVQAELSLDKIRVMRNDLSDADVEVVPARPTAKPNDRPVAAAKRKLELAESQSA